MMHRSLRFPFVALVCLALSGCGGCGGKKDRDSEDTPGPAVLSASVRTPSGVQKKTVDIDYTLGGPESESAMVVVQCSIDNGWTWRGATPASDSPETSALSTTPAGSRHRFIWDSVKDGVAPKGPNGSVRIRVTPYDPDPGVEGTTDPFTVDNEGAETTGKVAGCGRNQEGQLGLGQYIPMIPWPTDVPDLQEVRKIEANGAFTVAILKGGEVRTWGDNRAGQLGNGTARTTSADPQVVFDTRDVVDIAPGAGHCVALKSDGNVLTWGANISGQLGNGTRVDSWIPVPVTLSDKAIDVAAGMGHSMALLQDGTVVAWGLNRNGQIGMGRKGTGAKMAELSPVPVLSLQNIKAIAAGGEHSLALRGDGTVWAWGSNRFGELGNGSVNRNAPQVVPYQVAEVKDIMAIDAGLATSFALQDDGTVWQWGSYVYVKETILQEILGEQIMRFIRIKTKWKPRKVKGLNNVKQIAAGWAHALALKTDGTVYAWGYNLAGELGVGSPGSLWGPTKVGRENKTVTQIAAGALHSFVQY